MIHPHLMLPAENVNSGATPCHACLTVPPSLHTSSSSICADGQVTLWSYFFLSLLPIFFCLLLLLLPLHLPRSSRAFRVPLLGPFQAPPSSPISRPCSSSPLPPLIFPSGYVCFVSFSVSWSLACSSGQISVSIDDAMTLVHCALFPNHLLPIMASLSPPHLPPHPKQTSH